MQFFDNSNVMPLLGVCLDAGCPEAESAPCLVMPYMANGSLLTYLRKAKKVVVLPKDATSKRVFPVISFYELHAPIVAVTVATTC